MAKDDFRSGLNYVAYKLYRLGDEDGGSGWNNQKNLRCVDAGIERYLTEDMEHYGDRVAQAVMEGIQ